MKSATQVSFRNITETPAISEVIHKKIARLEKFFPNIIACRVLVDLPHNHSRHGKHYHVRIDLTVPGKEIVVNKDHTKDDAHADLYVAIRDSFNAATRQLEDYARLLREPTRLKRRAPVVSELDEREPMIDAWDSREAWAAV